MFCGADETIDHLFLSCPVSRFIWRVVGCTFGFGSFPATMRDIHTWFESFPRKYRQIIIIGSAALCWSIWKSRNAICFQNKYPGDPTNIVFSLCYWIDAWYILRKSDTKVQLLRASDILKKVVVEILN